MSKLSNLFLFDLNDLEQFFSFFNQNKISEKQNILLDNEMIGDTINIFIESVFNTEGGPSMYDPNSTSPREILETQIKIFDPEHLFLELIDGYQVFLLESLLIHILT